MQPVISSPRVTQYRGASTPTMIMSLLIPFLSCLILFPVSPVHAQSTTGGGGAFPDPLPSKNPTIAVTATGSVAQCSALNITWDYANVDNDDLIFLNINLIGLQSFQNLSIGRNVPLASRTYTWPKVDASVQQYIVYVANVPLGNVSLTDQSDAINVIAGGDPSCLTLPSSTQSLSVTSADSTAPASTIIALPPNAGDSQSSGGLSTGGIAGAVIGPLLALVCAVIAFLAWRRRKHNSGEGFSRRGKWGGLTSVDSRNALGPDYGPGTGPGVGAGVAATNGAFAYSRQRTDSLGKVSPEESDSLEEEKHRGRVATKLSVDGLDTVPPLVSYSAKAPRHSASSSISTSFTHGHQPFATAPAPTNYNQPSASYSQNSLTRARASSLKAFIANSSGNVGSGTTVPIIHPPTPTEGVRAYRSNSLSLPGSARESLDGATTPSPVPPHPPLPSATTNTPSPSPITPSGFNRSPSNNGLSRPTRKPVPVYDGDAMELLSHTPSSSPGTSSHLNHSEANLAGGSAMSRGGSLGGGGVSRGGGSVGGGGVGAALRLAAEGDGPVHYLMPDMPPPRRS